MLETKSAISFNLHIKIKHQFILVLFWVHHIHIILRCSYLGSACTEWPLPNDKREKANVLKLTHSNLQSHANGNFSNLEIEMPSCEMERCKTPYRISSFILKSYSWYLCYWVVTSNEDVEIPKESPNRQGVPKTTNKGPISLESGCFLYCWKSSEANDKFWLYLNNCKPRRESLNIFRKYEDCSAWRHRGDGCRGNFRPRQK